MTNRNSNLDRVIYDPSIVELDTMPVDNPPMDNVMPSFDGMEDPKVLEDYQQIELADGGVVEREGFSKGGVQGPIATGPNKGKYSVYIGGGSSPTRKTYHGTKSEMEKLFKNKATMGGTRVDVDSKKYPKGFGTKNQLMKKLKEKNIFVSEKNFNGGIFSKKFNIPSELNPYQKSNYIYDLTVLNDPKKVEDIQKRQVQAGRGTPEATKKYRKFGKKQTGDDRKKYIKSQGGSSANTFKAKESTGVELAHRGNIQSSTEKITGQTLGYDPKDINTKIIELDNKIRAVQKSKQKILTSNIPNVEKTRLIEEADSKLIRLASQSDGFKQVQLTGGGTFGGGRLVIDPTDIFPGKTEQEINDFLKQYVTVDRDSRYSGKIKPKFLDKQGNIRADVPQGEIENIKKSLFFNENRKASLKAAKNFPKKKIETLIQNIGCPTGSLKAAKGANCFIKGQEKIKAGKLNNNEFNILQKAVKSPASQTAIKYGGKALKVLGPVLAPIVLYDTYDQYKKGKPLAEILEYGLIGTDFSRDVRKMANYTPEEREAVQQAQQYERNEEDISGLSSDFDTPTNLSADEISELSVSGSKRVDDLLLAQDEAKEKQRVYTGAPEIEDYGERVGLKLGTPKKLYDLGKKILKNKEPENPDRRDFLKGAGALGLAVAAFGTGALKLAKTLKTKTALKVLAEPAVGQPAWFAPLVDKILLKGIRLEKDGKKLNKYVLEEDGKTITLETPNSPKNPININVKGGGAYDDPFDIQYYQTIDKTTGKTKASLQVLESRPYRFGPDADEVELSEEIFQGIDLLELPKGGSGILSDMEGLEKIATGKIKNTKLANTRMKVKDELNQPDNYRSRYNPGEEDRLTRSTGPDGSEYYDTFLKEVDEGDRIMTKNDLDPDIDYD